MEKISINKIDETIYHEVLDNGLNVYIHVNKDHKVFRAALTVNYGGKDTVFKLNGKTYTVPQGIAHYLEHTNFNMPGGKKAEDMFEKIHTVNVNAYTNQEFTSFHITSLTHLRENIEYLIEYVMTPYFTDKLTDKERGIIAQEIQRSKNNIDRNEYYSFMNALLKEDHEKYTVLGEEEDINKITAEDLEFVHKTFYHPENMVMVVNGNVDPTKVIEIIKNKFKEFKYDKWIKPEIISPKEPKEVNQKEVTIYENVAIPRIDIAYKMPRTLFKDLSKYEQDHYVYIIMNQNFNNQTEFNYNLKKDKIVKSIYGTVEEFDDYVCLYVSAEALQPDLAIEKIKEKIHNLEIDERSLLSYKHDNVSSMITGFDQSEIGNHITYDLMRYGRIINDAYDIHNDVTKEKLEELISRFDLSECSVLKVLPKEKRD